MAVSLTDVPCSDENAFAPSTSGKQPAVIAFSEPRMGTEGGLGSHRDMRNFMVSTTPSPGPELTRAPGCSPVAPRPSS